jgi:hypothetical protein
MKPKKMQNQVTHKGSKITPIENQTHVNRQDEIIPLDTTNHDHI